MGADSESNTGRLRVVGDAAGSPVYYDERRGTYHTHYDVRAYESVSTTLIAAMVEAFDVEVADLEYLGTAIEPDALNALFDHWANEDRRVDSGSVSFPFAGCTVTVRTNGEIEITPDETGQ